MNRCSPGTICGVGGSAPDGFLLPARYQALDTTIILTLIAGAVVAGFVQGLSGFAFSMVAMSFWAWALDPRLAATLAVFGALTGQLIAAVTVRRAVDITLLWPFLLGGLIGAPLGIAVLPMLDATLFKLALGAFLITFCPIILLAPRLPAIAAGGRIADGFVGLMGGVLGGLGGFAGVLPTLWCTLRGMAKDRQRVVIQNFNLATLAFAMLGHVASGSVTGAMLPYLGIVAVAVLVPVLLGSRLYIGLSDLAFRRIVLSLLTLSGLALLSASLPRLLAAG